jgi:hypothetical protein
MAAAQAQLLAPGPLATAQAQTLLALKEAALEVQLERQQAD